MAFVGNLAEQLLVADDEQFRDFAHGVRDHESDEIKLVFNEQFLHGFRELWLTLMEQFEIGFLHL